MVVLWARGYWPPPAGHDHLLALWQVPGDGLHGEQHLVAVQPVPLPSLDPLPSAPGSFQQGFAPYLRRVSGQGNAGHLQHLELGLIAGLHDVHHLHGVHLDLGLVPGHDGDVLHQPGHIAVALVVELLLRALHHCQFLFLVVTELMN